jgi:hypothetical protein
MFDLARQLGKKVFKVADRMPDRRDRISYGVASRNVYAATHYVRPQACLAKQVVKVAGVRRLGRSPQINDLTQHAKQIFPQIDVSGVVYGCCAGLLGGFCNFWISVSIISNFVWPSARHQPGYLHWSPSRFEAVQPDHQDGAG